MRATTDPCNLSPGAAWIIILRCCTPRRSLASPTTEDIIRDEYGVHVGQAGSLDQRRCPLIAPHASPCGRMHLLPRQCLRLCRALRLQLQLQRVHSLLESSACAFTTAASGTTTSVKAVGATISYGSQEACLPIMGRHTASGRLRACEEPLSSRRYKDALVL